MVRRSVSGSKQPDDRRAVVDEFKDETVFDWLRRQRKANRKLTTPRGVTQAAPRKETTPVAADVVRNTN